MQRCIKCVCPIIVFAFVVFGVNVCVHCLLIYVHNVCIVCVSVYPVCFLHVCVFCKINRAPVESCATVTISCEGGLWWDVGSECLLFAIIVVITSSAGISGACAPASLIITIPPWFSSCQFTVQAPLKNFPHCQTAEGFLFPLPFNFLSFFFVLFSSSLCCKEVCGHNVCMCVFGGGGQ